MNFIKQFRKYVYNISNSYKVLYTPDKNDVIIKSIYVTLDYKVERAYRGQLALYDEQQNSHFIFIDKLISVNNFDNLLESDIFLSKGDVLYVRVKPIAIMNVMLFGYELDSNMNL